jgi:hypothetical protein
MKNTELARIAALAGVKVSKDKLAEWANSANGKIEDRGTIMDQPEGPAINNSLRDYLGAKPMKVTIAGDITESSMVADYAKFKKSRK